MDDKTILYQLAHTVEAMQAHHEALTTIVQAMLPMIWNSPEFAENLKAKHEARVTNRLNAPVSDNLIREYHLQLTALLPSHLQPLVKQ